MNVSARHVCQTTPQVSAVGYEPAGLTMHPPPPQTIEGGLIFFA